MHKPVIRLVTLGVALPVVLGLTSCSIEVSNEAKEQGKVSLCASSNSVMGQIKAGGEGAKLAAQLIKDNSDDQKIKRIANEVIEGNGGKGSRDELVKYIQRKCK